MTDTLRKTANALREHALGLPGAYEDHPWGETVAKVNNKVFVFFGREVELDTHLIFSVKLPDSSKYALMQSYTEPTGYGLGKSGWVTVRFRAPGEPPTDLFLEWIEESYRAVAPKKLVARLNAPSPEEEKPAAKKSRKTQGKQRNKKSRSQPG
jgi:predicted DNA-binding protein (MmcQ/YjbR family)